MALRFDRNNAKRNEQSGIYLQVIIFYGGIYKENFKLKTIEDNIDMLKEKGTDNTTR